MLSRPVVGGHAAPFKVLQLGTVPRLRAARKCSPHMALAHEPGELALPVPAPASSSMVLSAQPELAGQQLNTYLQLMRPINLLPSIMLVLVGAWAGSGRTLLALRSATVWSMGLVSGGVAVAACTVNEYFDWASGVDAANSPSKPLPSGLVPADGVLLLGATAYIAVLIAACLMESAPLRLIIAASSLATLLYTPVLKRLTLVKNALVAAVVAASPLAGALAAGAGALGIRAVAAPAAFVFCGVMYREILMDMNDVTGDAAIGVWTVPVRLGKRAAMLVGFGMFVCATAGALAVASQASGLAWLWESHAWASAQAVRSIAMAAMTLAVWPAYAAAWAVVRSKYDAQVVSAAIDGSLQPIGLTMLLLAAVV